MNYYLFIYLFNTNWTFFLFLYLKNNNNRETEPDWVQELEVDIKEECQQYGAVEHINVDGDSLVIYLFI